MTTTNKTDAGGEGKGGDGTGGEEVAQFAFAEKAQLPERVTVWMEAMKNCWRRTATSKDAFLSSFF